jgi:hypothetical protein
MLKKLEEMKERFGEPGEDGIPEKLKMSSEETNKA